MLSSALRSDVPKTIINAAMEGVKPTAETKGVRLEKVIDRLMGSISGDPARLQQVLWNLLTNAIKFTSKGGKVRVFAEVMQSHVEISVADTGEGISPDFLPHLFERFSQADGSAKRKHRGLGLGLSIVKNLVEMHGGAVRANSRGKGQGVTFIVRLPRQAPKSSEDEENPSHTRMLLSVECERPNLRGIKVLVVEDEADARELLRRFLVECDALPAVAASVAEAQKLLLTFQPDRWRRRDFRSHAVSRADNRFKNLGICASRASVTAALAELGLELELSGWALWRLLERGTEWILESKSELVALRGRALGRHRIPPKRRDL
jgi:hypothetical protein